LGSAAVSIYRGDYLTGGIGIVAAAVQLVGVPSKLITGSRDAGILAHGVSELSHTGLATQFTRSNLRLGLEKHAGYRLGEVNPALGRIKEYRIPNSGGKRIDYLDMQSRTIYELKPNNPRSIREGTRQLERYKDLMEREFGAGWKTVLDTY
jgi:hypothetical protein